MGSAGLSPYPDVVLIFRHACCLTSKLSADGTASQFEHVADRTLPVEETSSCSRWRICRYKVPRERHKRDAAVNIVEISGLFLESRPTIHPSTRAASQSKWPTMQPMLGSKSWHLGKSRPRGPRREAWFRRIPRHSPIA